MVQSKLKWGFNLSYSTYSMYLESPLQFYFTKIIEAPADTQTNQYYGNCGNVVHNSEESYLRDVNIDLDKVFDENWIKLNIDNLRDFKGNPANRTMWFGQLKNCVSYTNEVIFTKGYDEIIPEKYFEFYPENLRGIQVKGWMDVFCRKGDDIDIYDWKTNAWYDEDTHKKQRLFYSWACYKEFGIIPNCHWYYTRGKIPHSNTFTLQEIEDFDKEIENFINDIIEKGDDINKYPVGEIGSPFNNHIKKCARVKMERESNSNDIMIYRKGNRMIFPMGLPSPILEMINIRFKYKVEGYHFMPENLKNNWDGIRRFLKNDSLPYGFINEFKRLVDMYNESKGTFYRLSIKDLRDEKVVNSTYTTQYKETDIELRPFQEDAVREILQKKVGILRCPCGFGKTLTAGNLIKRVNKRSLFLIHRIELVRQTKEEFEDYFGVPVGEMSEGNIDITHQHTVASIQTVYSILKRNNQDSKKLKLLLYNINLVVMDESQVVSDAGTYGVISEHLMNAEFLVGLSATPYRNYEPSTLEMNSLTGFVIYEMSSQELERLGYLSPIKIAFLKVPQRNDVQVVKEYHEDYKNLIVEYETRNKIALDLVNKFRDKKVLILCNRVEHLKIIQEMIPEADLIYGETPRNERKEIFNKFKDSDSGILISMVTIMAVGVNFPDLDVIINLSGHSSSILTIQSAGRVSRTSPNKKFGWYFDILDLGEFEKMSKARIKALKSEGKDVTIINYLEGDDK